MKTYIAEELKRCGWNQCSEFVEPGIAVLTDGKVWHGHCHYSPANRGPGEDIMLEYSCPIPEDPSAFFKQQDLDALLGLEYFRNLEDAVISLSPEKKRDVYVVLMSLKEKSTQDKYGQNVDLGDIRIIAEFYAADPDRFTPEAIEAFSAEWDTKNILSDDAGFYFRFRQASGKPLMTWLEQMTETLSRELKVQLYQAVHDIVENNHSGAQLHLLLIQHV